ncbi:MAG TPA: hypothetical protein VFA41_17105 [Ktedonobacteraceae bacterium]|jgi:hypothetical protein|nr:hypothetical protein [Ktedonobacteraceae bacterium]
MSNTMHVSMLDVALSETIADLERIAATDEPPTQYYAAVGAIKGFLLYQLAESAQLTDGQRAQIRTLVERWDACQIAPK